MKLLSLFAGVLCLLLISCHPSAHTLNDSIDLPRQEFSITIDRDTTLVTANGALLEIPKGSLSGGQNNVVSLEIREALSLQQMIMAGLVTASNGEPLSSGGMIYINAKAGQEVKINRPIRVAIPGRFISTKMQLYRGETTGAGNINWVNPAPLPATAQTAQLDSGRILFEKNCASCHGIGKEKTGPDLAHWLKWLPDEQRTVRKYHVHYPYSNSRPADTTRIEKQDSVSYWRSDWEVEDVYACNMRAKYGSIGTAFNLSKGQLDAIYRFIQNESEANNLPLPADAYLDESVDSCYRYAATLEMLNTSKAAAEYKRLEQIAGNGLLVDKKPDPTWGISNTLPPDFDQRVTPGNYESVYYQFTIETFGWFNIDALLKGFDGVQDSELFVRITGEIREKIKIYLIIPSMKVYGEGGPADRDPNEFAFFYKTGHLPLPQGRTAYILAVTETSDSLAFGLREFTTGLKQELSLSLARSTKEKFTAAISALSMDNMSITVADSKNADSIRRLDKTIRKLDEKIRDAEKLKPRNCDCACHFLGEKGAMK
jgi:hypothetical protein